MLQVGATRIICWKSTDVWRNYRLHVQGRRISQARNRRESTRPRLAYSSILKMEAICSSKTSVDFQRTTRHYTGGTRYRSWLKHYATSQKVAGSIPDEVIGFFSLPNPSSRNTALGSTQPLTEMSIRNLPGGKGRPARKADNLCLENVGASTSHNPMGLHGLLQGWLYLFLTFYTALYPRSQYSLLQYYSMNDNQGYVSWLFPE
jgi:hypothetical protein